MSLDRCTCNNGIRYFKGKPTPCQDCEKGKALGLKNNITEVSVSPLLKWREAFDNIHAFDIVEEKQPVEEILDVNDLLKIPDIYRDKHYSRAEINKLIGQGENPLFDKLDQMMLDIKKGVLQRGNFFFAAPNSLNLMLWAYDLLREAYENNISVVPITSLDILYSIYRSEKENYYDKEQVELIRNNKLNISWLDCIFADLLILTLPATFYNKDLAFLMTLIDSRNAMNQCTCVMSYWASKYVAQRDGGNFIFKNGDQGVSLFEIYEYYPQRIEGKPQLKKF